MCFVAPALWCTGNPRESFKISLRGGELRVRQLPWMAGNKRTETKRGQAAQSRCGGKEGEQVNAWLSVNLHWFERASLGNCECFRGQRAKDFEDLTAKCLLPCWSIWT